MKKLLLFFAVLITAFTFCACKDDNVEKNTVKTLSAADFAEALGGKNAEIKYLRKLDNNTPGLTQGNNKLVLVKYKNEANKTQYDICLAEYDSLKVNVISYGDFSPLEIVKEKFVGGFSEDEQQKNLDIVFDFVSQYGINCFDDKNLCELYLKRLTKNDKLITVSEAKSAIEQNITHKEPALDVYSEIRVMFSPESAVPQYYAFKDGDSKSKPNWGVMDSLFEKLPGVSFDSYEELERFLVGEKNNSTKVEPEKGTDKSDKYTDENGNDKNHEQPSKETPSENDSEILYRVRKSYEDSSSQLGAFSVLENAKALADAHKDEGYRVYDNNGNVVYTP